MILASYTSLEAAKLTLKTVVRETLSVNAGYHQVVPQQTKVNIERNGE